MKYLYDSQTGAQALCEAVAEAMNWPKGGTQQWDELTQIEQGDYEGMWYVSAPPDYCDMSGVDCPEPDVKAEYSSDWHPTPELE